MQVGLFQCVGLVWWGTGVRSELDVRNMNGTAAMKRLMYGVRPSM